MKKRLFLLVAAFLMSSPAYAGEASHRKACEDLMKMWNVDKMIGFYNSPIGKKSIEKAPELMTKVFAMSQHRGQRFMPEIDRLSKEMAEEIRQRKQSNK